MADMTAPTEAPAQRRSALRIVGIILLAVLLLAVGIALGLLARSRWSLSGAQPQTYYGPSMMQGWNNGPQGDTAPDYGPRGRGGMMGGYGGDYGYGRGGMMGGVVPDADLVPAEGERLTLDQAKQAAEAYVANYGDNLEVTEVIEFDNHFYAEVHEVDTGTGAFELLIDPNTAAVYPEPGPNMMWNTKYGHMGGYGRGMMGGGNYPAQSGEMTVTPDEAVTAAQTYLDNQGLGRTVEDAEEFYGYYTLEILQDGEPVGMLSVNGYTGDVWEHTWHGTFIGMAEADED